MLNCRIAESLFIKKERRERITLCDHSHSSMKTPHTSSSKRWSCYKIKEATWAIQTCLSRQSFCKDTSNKERLSTTKRLGKQGKQISHTLDLLSALLGSLFAFLSKQIHAAVQTRTPLDAQGSTTVARKDRQEDNGIVVGVSTDCSRTKSLVRRALVEVQFCH